MSREELMKRLHSFMDSKLNPCMKRGLNSSQVKAIIECVADFVEAERVAGYTIMAKHIQKTFSKKTKSILFNSTGWNKGKKEEDETDLLAELAKIE